jgi:hypothetical protein
MSPQKQEQSKNQNLPRCFFPDRFCCFSDQKVRNFWNDFFAANSSNLNKNHQIFYIKKLGQNSILHRTDPRKSIN